MPYLPRSTVGRSSFHNRLRVELQLRTSGSILCLFPSPLLHRRRTLDAVGSPFILKSTFWTVMILSLPCVVVNAALFSQIVQPLQAASQIVSMMDSQSSCNVKTFSTNTGSGQPFVVDPGVERYVTITDDGDYLPIFTPKRFMKDIRDFEVRPTDIFVITWPRSGTTWTQYMLTQVVHGPASAHKLNLFEANTFLEFPRDPDNLDTTELCYKVAEEAPNPRLLKSHLPMEHLPSQIFRKRPKIIYVARNPKDAAVSYYNFTIMHKHFPNYGDWSAFYEHSVRGFVPYGDWFSHVLSWWKLRNEPNVLFLKYEDITKDTKATVEKLSSFLERPLPQEKVKEICRQSKFSEMSKNRNANLDLMGKTTLDKSTKQKFMRKGTVGDWRNYYTPAQNDHFDALYRKEMEGSGLNFDFGL